MKSVRSITIFALFFLAGCVSLPSLEPLSIVDNDPVASCQRPWVTEKRQFIHAISATLPDGKKTLITGVTTIYPEERSVHAVIMTIEGLVLFEGRTKGDKIEIQRGISLFSSGAFAEGLMNDVRLIFLKPATAPTVVGSSRGYAVVCRYRDSDTGVVDVKIGQGGDWELARYDSANRLQRSVITRSGPDSERGSVPGRIKLTAGGTFGYSLDMRLIQ